MKTLLLIFSFLFSIYPVFSNTSSEESKKIAIFCKVWGYLKYYHPVVANGKFDWDKQFTNKIKILSSLNSKDEINNFYMNWLESLGRVKPCKECKTEIADSLKYNLDLKWLHDSSVFNSSITKQLFYIQQNRNQGKNYYVQKNPVGNTNYSNEKRYKDSIFPSPELRLLGLSRYWNIINYFFPYKYKTDQYWDNVLLEMVPKFKDVNNITSYHLNVSELTAKINDSHAGFYYSYYTAKYFGLKYPPFGYTLIDNKAIATHLFNDSFSKIADIRVGDVFLKVNGEDIREIIKEKSKYFGASNEAVSLRNLQNAIFSGQSDSFIVTFERNGEIKQKTVYRYYFSKFNYKWQPNKEVWRMLPDNIGYVNLGNLTRKQVRRVMKKMKHTKGIIFDVRNYPKGTMYKISNFLNSEKRQFVKFTEPDLNYPGVFRYTKPFTCGKKNKKYYKGRVILLFNETTQSHAEFTLMALQTAPNITCIGSQTAGADGNVSLIILPGNIKTYMTGIGVYYPDGRETQRIGIKPDIEIKPTIEGIRSKRDEVLEKAIEVLRIE
jgi:carboxyl-terminal processing protease